MAILEVLTLEAFLRPLEIDIHKIHGLARSLATTYERLARESKDQFLSTPISDSVLRPVGDTGGRYLAIDIGGTNLRVGFIELLKPEAETAGLDGISTIANGEPKETSRVRRQLEKSWPIGEQLKRNKAEDLFAWIGSCIAEVVGDGCKVWAGELPEEIPLGVTFSFPMIQHTLSHATLMSMGKGFAITSNSDLGKLLIEGYESVRNPTLPTIKIHAIVNDSVATLVSFAYQLRSNPKRKAAMGLIVGTGCNATIPLALNKLHTSKRPAQVKVLNDSAASDETKITVNTEWSINGSAPALRESNFITRWDEVLDSQGDTPGFMPFEYMTAGRYLGELGRLILLDYFIHHLGIARRNLPPSLLERHGLSTSFLGNLGPHLQHIEPSMLRQLEKELPPAEHAEAFHWTEETAEVVYKVGKAIQVRAAGMTAAAIIGLLSCADEISLSPLPTPNSTPEHKITNGNHVPPSNKIEELMVGYTGGCISHFQDFLEDCQRFLDAIMDAEFGEKALGVPRVVLTPCHDGGIIGAGILAGTVKGISSPS
ncbi:hypothetical protein HYFRA_00006190 [Hymenoscyphus fraxineus]|uniref:Phosphotransferase n=1 Tax=Hymenoscyphus fraxineus TaxID=746836 RepID=A0A9N9LBQ8_9HELO|nr:hypothetical protein HYFRA_00006190 [Hymenoscyphus fraxineus]